MSCQVDQAIGQSVIDSLEFAREGGVLRGEVPVAALKRLADVLADAAGSFHCELFGSRDREGKSYLNLRAEGDINLRCQRCLSPLSFRLAVDSRLLLVAPGAEWPDDELADDRMDAIEASREQAVLPLIEDEVLLALPIAPRHGNCRPPQATGEDQKPSPFAVLAGLKKH